MIYFSNFQWPRRAIEQKPGLSAQVIEQSLHSSRVLRDIQDDTQGTVDPTKGIQHASALANWGFKRHVDVFSRYFTPESKPQPNISASDLEDAKRFYALAPYTSRLFFSAQVNYSDIPAFMRDVEQQESVRSQENIYKVVRYNGDELELEVTTSAPQWLSFIDNWDKHWIAEINGQQVPIHVLLGSYKSVQLPAGTSKVSFRYRPFANRLSWLMKLSSN